MAYKRMFNKEITNSDVFLDMPLSSQALYFHLGMNSDDDGFVNPKSILRLVGAKEDDLGVLILRGFVIQFLDGILVITHWKRNNNIRSDRYTPTIYKEHLKILKIEENIYKKDNSELQCIPVVGQVVYPGIDIGIDIGIDTGEKKQSALQSKDAVSLSFGTHVRLTEDRYSALILDFGKEVIDSKIEDINLYCASKGVKYKDYAAVVRKWLKKDDISKINEKSDNELINEFLKGKVKFAEKYGKDKYYEIKDKRITSCLSKPLYL